MSHESRATNEGRSPSLLSTRHSRFSTQHSALSTSWPKAALAALLAVLAIGTRLPAPWRVEIINDEMFHIKSWRHRYRTGDVMPIFPRRLEQTNRLSASQKEWLLRLYRESPWFQRLLCLKSDYASVGYSTLAEAIEALSHSNLIALRVPSVLFSLGSIVLAYVLGKALMDGALGLWLAAFFAVGPLDQVYAGIGRPHMLTRFALLAVIWMFVLEERQCRASPWRFLTVALLAQTTHLTIWAVIGVLVASELVRRYLAGNSLWGLIRQTWWYAALSLALLAIIATGTMGTSVIGANVYYPGVETWWNNFCIASPFGHLAAFGEPWMWASGIAWAGLIGNGLRVVFAEQSGCRAFRWPFLVALLVSLLVPLYASSGVRHMMIYGVVPTILSALGARDLFRAPRAALMGVAIVLAIFTPLSFACRECPYRFILTGETRYSEVATRLAAELKPGDVWVSWPYFACCPLYPYASLPEPIMPLTGVEFVTALHNRPDDRACFVFMNEVDENVDPALKQATLRVKYPNGMVLLKLPLRGREGE
jgi:hypothetical protein